MMRIFKIIFLLCLISSAVYSQRIVIPLRSAEIKAGTDVIWSLNIKEGFNDTTIDIARKIYTPTVNFNINIPVCRSFYMGAFYNTNKMFGIKGTFKDDNIFYINNYKDPATDALGNPRLLLKWNIEMEMYGISMMFKNVNISKNYYALEIFKVKSSLSYSLPVNYDDRFPVKETDSVYFIDNTTSRLLKDLPGFLENYPKKENTLGIGFRAGKLYPVSQKISFYMEGSFRYIFKRNEILSGGRFIHSANAGIIIKLGEKK